MPVSRFDLSEFLGDAFTDGPVTGNALVRLALARGARPAVLNTLRRLPARPYAHLDDVFHALPAVPEELDPWADATRPS